MEEIGFLGIGIMGKAMAVNLLRHGFKVTVWNRTLSRVLFFSTLLTMMTKICDLIIVVKPEWNKWIAHLFYSLCFSVFVYMLVCMSLNLSHFIFLPKSPSKLFDMRKPYPLYNQHQSLWPFNHTKICEECIPTTKVLPTQLLVIFLYLFQFSTITKKKVIL